MCIVDVKVRLLSRGIQEVSTVVRELGLIDDPNLIEDPI